MCNLIFQYEELKISSSVEMLVWLRNIHPSLWICINQKSSFMTNSSNKFEVIKKHSLGLFCFCFILATINTTVKRIGFRAR